MQGRRIRAFVRLPVFSAQTLMPPALVDGPGPLQPLKPLWTLSDSQVLKGATIAAESLTDGKVVSRYRHCQVRGDMDHASGWRLVSFMARKHVPPGSYLPRIDDRLPHLEILWFEKSSRSCTRLGWSLPHYQLPKPEIHNTSAVLAASLWLIIADTCSNMPAVKPWPHGVSEHGSPRTTDLWPPG